MRKIAQHWKILLWLVAGVVVGGVFQYTLDAPAHSGLTVKGHAGQDHVDVTSAKKPADPERFARGDKLWSVVVNQGKADERRSKLTSPDDLTAFLRGSEVGDILWFEVGDAPGDKLVPLTLVMDPESPRAQWVAPFRFLADIFMALLKMLIVPLVLTSIISGVAGVGQLQDLRRMGLKIFAYYVATSLLAILIGQTLVNVVRPGDGAELGLPPSAGFDKSDESLIDVLLRMVPENLFAALSDNGAMLQIIFFGLLFGLCITRAPEPHKDAMTRFFGSAFEVMMRVAELVLK
ncbi:MAG: cation:dicarboxylase symporter family transporter, partial [Planctomycetota bacterium]